MALVQVEWQGVNKLQNSKAELLKAIATRIDKLLGDKCTATTWDCVNEQGNASNNACPACLVDFTPSLQVRALSSQRVPHDFVQAAFERHTYCV